jgi:hypothetical protein
MAIFGRPEFIPVAQRDSIMELAGVRGFGGEFEKSLYVKGVEGKEVATGSAGALTLDAARVQQQVSRARPDYWAEVHAIGMGEKGVFVAVDYYPKSAEELVKAGTALSGRALYRMISSVVKGLRDLQQVASRPHGNLKPSNVLISSADPQEARTVLTDPAPAQSVARGKVKDDLFQLGQLIHELVLHHPFTGAWPVAPTRAWSDLGRRGRGWRKLCNRLLNPNPEKRPRRLAWVAKQVQGLRPKKAAAMRPILAMLVLGAVGAAAAMNWNRIEHWSRTTLHQRLAASTQPAQPQKVEPDKPRQLVVVPQNSTAAPATTQAAPREQMMTAEAHFLAQYQAIYEQRGWNGPAQYLANLRGRFATTSANETTARKALGDTEELLKTIEGQWKTLSERTTFVVEHAHNDPVLLTYGQFVKQSIEPVIARASGASPLPALLEALQRAANDPAWGQVIAYLQSADAQKLDHPWMVESSPLHKRFGNKAVASAEDLQQWLAEARQPEFSRLAASDDPRPRWSARQQIARIRANDLSRLASLFKDSLESAKAAAVYERKLTELDQSAAKVLASDAPWSVKNRPEITSSIAHIDQEIAKVSDELRSAVARRQNDLEAEAVRVAAAARQRQEAVDFVLKLEAMKVSAVPAVQKEWENRSKGIADEIRADPMRFNPAAAEKVGAIRQKLEIVDAALKGVPEKLDLKVRTAQWNQRLASALESMDAKQRERMLDELVGASRELSVVDLKNRATETRKRYDEWSTSATKLVSDLNEVDRLLAAGYSLDERPGRDRPAAREILNQWQKQDWIASEAVQSSISQLLAPIRVLERADGPTLVQMAASGEHRLGLRLMAWRNLAATATAWPVEQEDLKQAVGISDALLEAVANNAPEDRREQLRMEVSSATAKMWNRFIAGAKKAEEINFALGLRQRLAIPVEMLDARTRFNAAVYDARRGQGSDENAPARVAASLQSAIEALPAGQRDSRELSDLVSALRQSRAGAQRIDFSTLGTMARRARGANPINWKVKYDEASETVSYTARVSMDITPDELEIVFKRVETETGDVYLSTSEISVGLFADVITAADRWREVAPMLWSYDPRDGDPRPGPRSWEWPRYGRLTSGIRRTNVWLAGGGDHYPESLATAENRTVLKDENGKPARELNPSKRQPMQYVSPEAAIYFCDLLSCRLPTSGEWKSAYRLHAGDHWNLRDRTFKMLQRWLYGPSVAERFMPDLGIFMSAGEKPTAEVWMESKVLAPPAQSDREYNDGALWFREVSSGGANNFNHLVGNVAEMTLENGHLYTIGGSALSPPTRPIDQELEIPNWKGGNKGYSDVGFRLAFSGPANPRQYLLAALQKQAYLLP